MRLQESQEENENLNKSQSNNGFVMFIVILNGVRSVDFYILVGPV